MKIIVVGAGIGGLSVALALALEGHSVVILEAAPALAEIGAGVQMTPTATRWFWKWGLGPDILAHSVLPAAFQVKRWSDGENLARVSFDEFEQRYGAPYIVIHRADIHRILHRHAVKAGVDVRTNSRVVKYDFEDGVVTLASGQTYRGDLVVAADGINSFARKAFLEEEMPEQLEKTGWAAYRTWASVDEIKKNQTISHLAAQHDCRCWSGDRAVVMTYMVKNSAILNIVLSHPDDVDTAAWTEEQYLAEIRRLYSRWDVQVTELLNIISPKIQNWPIYQVKSLPRWTSHSGKFVLVGDAAHAMAFYLSMGVSMAVEDAIALVECLSLKQSKGLPLSSAMSAFQSVRKPRAEAIRDASVHAGNVLQMPPGPTRDIRDEMLRNDGIMGDDDEGMNANSYGIADRKIRDWCYGYDVISELKRALHVAEYSS